MAGGGYYGDPGDAPDDSYLWGAPPPADTNFNWSFNPTSNPVIGNNQNYSGNPFDPYGSTTNTENNTLPFDPNDPAQNGSPFIPVNNDPGIIGSSTYDPMAGLTPNNNLPINPNDGLNMGGGMPGGSGGSSSGNNGIGIPVPGIGWPVALGADILLNNGNIFGGGGSPTIGGIATNVGNAVTNPGGAITNVGNSIMGPTSGQGSSPSVFPINFPSGSSGSTSNPVTPVEPPQQTTVVPVAPGPAPTNPVQSTGTDAPQSTTVTPVAPGPAPVNPVATDNRPASTTVNPLPPGPAPSNPTQTDNGGSTTVVPLNPGTGGGSTTTNPTVTTVPTTPVPTDTSIVSPLDRNLLTEGNTSNTDLASFLQSIMGNYGSASGSAGQTDFTNWQNILGQFGTQNQNLTGLSNDQTQAANTALRTNNLNDVQNLLPQATAIRNAANPGLLGDSGSLQNYSNGAASFLSQAQQQQNDANFLSPQEMNTAQQSARNAWSSRGLVNSPGAVGAEILNTDSALRARQQQAFTNTQGALNTYGQSVGAQQQNVFDPFGAILGGQYGQQTSNAGSNANLYGQSSAFSSGQQGNAYAQNVTNPFSPYIQDLNSGNFNAANARNIAASNNAAAVQGANTAQNSALANSFLRLFGQSLAGTCWVARSVFGADNPQWLLFRHWLLTHSPSWFRNLYMKHGEKFALWLDKNSWLKPVIRRFMESRIKTLYASGLRGSHDAGFGYGYKMKGGC